MSGGSSDPKSELMKSTSFNYASYQALKSSEGEFGFDRRFAYSRQSSMNQSATPRTPATVISNSYSQAQRVYSRSVSSIDIPSALYPGSENDYSLWKDSGKSEERLSPTQSILMLVRILRTGNRPMKRLFLLTSLNVAYSTTELFIGLISGRVGIFSDI